MVINGQNVNKVYIFENFSWRLCYQHFLCFFHLSGFLFTVNSKYFFNSWCCILDYFILNCKLWDNVLNSMIILILIISFILMFYRNFDFIFEFMAPKTAPICGKNVCLSFFFGVFLYLIVIILIEENKKNLTLCQNNEKWTKNSMIYILFRILLVITQKVKPKNWVEHSMPGWMGALKL